LIIVAMKKEIQSRFLKLLIWLLEPTLQSRYLAPPG